MTVHMREGVGSVWTPLQPRSEDSGKRRCDCAEWLLLITGAFIGKGCGQWGLGVLAEAAVKSAEVTQVVLQSILCYRVHVHWVWGSCMQGGHCSSILVPPIAAICLVRFDTGWCLANCSLGRLSRY